MPKIEKRHKNIDYAHRKVVVLPVSAMDESFSEGLKELGRKPDMGIEETLTYRLPALGEDDNRTIRVYIGSVYADDLLNFAHTNNLKYQEAVEMRLLVVMMETVLVHGEDSMADECVKMARCLVGERNTHIMDGAFELLYNFFGVGSNVKDIIHYIQDNI